MRRISALFLLLLSISPAWSAPTVTTPEDWRTYKRDADNVADMTISGTYTGSPTGIMAKWGDEPAVKIVSSPTGGTFTGTLPNQPAGRSRYQLRVYNEGSDPDSGDSVENIGVGDIIVCWGQSGISGRGVENQISAFAGNNALSAGLFANTGHWAILADPYDSSTGSIYSVSNDSATGSWVIHAVDDYMELNDVTVGVIPCAKGNTTVAQWAFSTSPSTLCGSMVLRADQTGVTEFWCILGESNALALTSQGTFATGLNEIIDALHERYGAKTVVAKIIGGNWVSGQAAINAGIEDVITENERSIRGPDFSAFVSVGNDIQHITLPFELEYASGQWTAARQNNIVLPEPEGYESALVWDPVDYAGTTPRVLIKNLSDIPAWAAAEINAGHVKWTNENNQTLYSDDDLADYSNNGTTVAGVHGILFPSGDSDARLIAWFDEDSPAHEPYPKNTFRDFWFFYPRGSGADHSPGGNDLTATGGYTVGGVSGPINGSQATHFNGTTQYGSSTVSPPPTGFLSTLLGSHKPTAVNIVAQSLLSVTTTPTANNYAMLWANNASNSITFRSTATRTAQGGTLVAGQWANSVGVNVGNNVKNFYHNGAFAAVNNSSGIMITPFNRITVGAWVGDTTTWYYGGDVTMLGMAKSAWTAAQADDLHDQLNSADPDQSDYFGLPSTHKRLRLTGFLRAAP